jgi:penicillin-binding protein 1A
MAAPDPVPSPLARLRARGARAAAGLRGAVAWVRRHPWRSAAVPPLLGVVYLLILIPLTPSIGDLRKFGVEVPAVVLSSDGVVLAEYRRLNRRWVPLDRISSPMIDALLATEDRRFYRHFGIDPVRTAGALLRTLGGTRQGGSTITQQLARNLFPTEIGRAPTINRKLKEAITALKIEAVYSKDEILEIYLNTVPFLYNAFGVEMAARTYFDSRAERLDVLQSATLVGMLKGNAVYNPVINPERARARRNLVLALMVRSGKLDEAQLASLQARPLGVDFERQQDPPGPAPHLARWLRQWLIEWADRRGYDIYADGLVVRTTVDSKIQAAANRAVTRQLTQLQAQADRSRRGGASPPLEAGFVAMDPRSGFIRAWVGSRDFATSPFDHVRSARRQPGSTFKPFVYGAAFENGISPQARFDDVPVSIRLPGGEIWSPKDTRPPTGRSMTLREALAQSRNTVTAQLMQQVGPRRVARLATAMGVRESRLHEVPSLALGTSAVTLYEMVAAYGPIANGGLYHPPSLVLRIERQNGEVLAQFSSPEGERAMSRKSSLALVDALRGVVDHGTGVAIRQRFGIQADVAGKTGTTQNNTDGWFILAHPQLVAGAWVGFDDPANTMGPWGEGARSALPMVGEVYQQALRNRWLDASAEFEIPRPGKSPPASESPLLDFIGGLVERVLRELRELR